METEDAQRLAEDRRLLRVSNECQHLNSGLCLQIPSCRTVLSQV